MKTFEFGGVSASGRTVREARAKVEKTVKDRLSAYEREFDGNARPYVIVGRSYVGVVYRAPTEADPGHWAYSLIPCANPHEMGETGMETWSSTHGWGEPRREVIGKMREHLSQIGELG